MKSNLNFKRARKLHKLLRATARKPRKQALPAGSGKGFGAFLGAVITKNEKLLAALGSRFVPWEDMPQTKTPRHWPADQKAVMSETSGTPGGYLVPEQFVPLLMRSVESQSVVRPRATLVERTTKSARVPNIIPTLAPSSRRSLYRGIQSKSGLDDYPRR
jgi:HK97 family phage major capsid protein